ncbi:hypothetical protein B0H13DRAFT_1884668 [Mycena leptocephala]|nr:hypothetical protein B0H13DRAFT_1884668 [Mycena leptocephala]
MDRWTRNHGANIHGQAPRMLAKGISVVEWEVLTNKRESIPKILGLTEQIEATVPGDLAKTREIERKVRYASIGSVDDLAGAELNPRLTHCRVGGCGGIQTVNLYASEQVAHYPASSPRNGTRRVRGHSNQGNLRIAHEANTRDPAYARGFKPRKFTHRTRGKYEGIKPMHFSASRTGFYGDDPDGKTRSTSSSGIDPGKNDVGGLNGWQKFRDEEGKSSEGSGVSWSVKEEGPIVCHSAVTRHYTASAGYSSAPKAPRSIEHKVSIREERPAIFYIK